MSVVIAIKQKDKIYVGCDTQVSSGSGYKGQLKGPNQKIWHHNDLPNLVMGGVGSLRDIQIIQTCKDVIDPLAILTKGVDFSYLVNNFFSNVYTTLLEKNRVPLNEHGHPASTIESAFLVAIDDKMFIVDQDGSVMGGEDYLVIGSGASVATGVLETNKNKKAKDRILEAIQACSDNTLYVNEHVVLTST